MNKFKAIVLWLIISSSLFAQNQNSINPTSMPSADGDSETAYVAINSNDADLETAADANIIEADYLTGSYDIFVTAYKECYVALISDAEGSGGQYGWWSVWHDLKSQGVLNSTPIYYSNLKPGNYTLIVYDPQSVNYDPNNGRANEKSDGVIIENVYVDGTSFKNYNLRQNDFKDWNCLSCPWLYLYDGNEFVKYTEVIKDVVGEENCKLDQVQIPSKFIIDNKVTMRIVEEKEEDTFIDLIELSSGTDKAIIEYSSIDTELFRNEDNSFQKLVKGDEIVLTFNLGDNFTEDNPVYLSVKGYYEPNEEFVKSYVLSLNENFKLTK